MTRKQIIVNNFLGGIAWGLGATVGVAIILTVVGFLIKRVDFIPLIGDFVTKVSVYVSQRTPNLLQ